MRWTAGMRRCEQSYSWVVRFSWFERLWLSFCCIRRRESGEGRERFGFISSMTDGSTTRPADAVNLLRGYQPVRIVNPLELIYGNEDEDF